MTTPADIREAGTTMNTTRYMEELQSYMGTLLWQATDEEGYSLDETFDLDDFAPETWRESETDLQGFVTLCEDEGIDVESLPAGSVGHDFALTRNHHGAGFWDRGYGALGDELTKWAQTFGSVHVYAADDQKLYTL